MKPRTLLLALLTGVVLTSSGCSSYFRQPANVETTRDEVAALRRDQTELLALVRELNARLESQSESISALRADTNLQWRQLEERLTILLAQLEEQGVRFRRMSGRGGDTRPAPADTSAGTPGPSGGSDSPRTLFDAAQRDFNQGNYQLAIAGFDDFLKLAPESQLADNAQYWKGESYYSLGDMDRAIQELLKVRDVYPEGDAVAEATLKVGYAFLRNKDTATAKRYFETVTREFPSSEEATLAQEKLDGLN